MALSPEQGLQRRLHGLGQDNGLGGRLGIQGRLAEMGLPPTFIVCPAGPAWEPPSYPL